MFTGTWTVEFVERLQDRSVSQPVAALHARPDNDVLKRNAIFTKFRYRLGNSHEAQRKPEAQDIVDFLM